MFDLVALCHLEKFKAFKTSGLFIVLGDTASDPRLVFLGWLCFNDGWNDRELIEKDDKGDTLAELWIDLLRGAACCHKLAANNALKSAAGGV